MNKNFALAYSGGKDSILALHKLIENNYIPKVIFTIFNEAVDGGNHHSLSKEILNKVSKHLDIPIEYFYKSNTEIYQDVYPDFLSTLKKYDIKYCAFGDIFLEGCKANNSYFCEQAGLQPLFPLWGMNEEDVFNEIISAGYKGIVKAIDTSRLCECLLGISIDDLYVKLLDTPNVSLCGEYGEYHTFIYDGPIFKDKIDFCLGETIYNRPYKTIMLS